MYIHIHMYIYLSRIKYFMSYGGSIGEKSRASSAFDEKKNRQQCEPRGVNDLRVFQNFSKIIIITLESGITFRTCDRIASSVQVQFDVKKNALVSDTREIYTSIFKRY